jgi:adenine-specific DNA-methyltransferase
MASQLKRKWIGIDNSSAALDTILHRFAKGLEPMGDFVNRKPKASQLPLFNSSQLSIINKFSLYVTDLYLGELDGFVKQWKIWQ